MTAGISTSPAPPPPSSVSATLSGLCQWFNGTNRSTFITMRKFQYKYFYWILISLNIFIALAYCDDDIISPTTTQPIPHKRSGGEGREGRDGRDGREGRGGGGGGGGGGGKMKLDEHDALQNKRNQNANFIIKFNERINLTHTHKEKEKKKNKKKERGKNCLHEFVSNFDIPQKSSVHALK